jgi:hypothetical protein
MLTLPRMQGQGMMAAFGYRLAPVEPRRTGSGTAAGVGIIRPLRISPTESVAMGLPAALSLCPRAGAVVARGGH